MPELPEVEITRAGIAPHILNKKVTKLTLYSPKLRWTIPKNVLNLQQQLITQVTRRGKYILLETAAGTAIIHLGMSGYLQLLPQNTALKKHDHFEMLFENKLCLRLNDARRFGALLWQAPAATHPVLQQLGPEPLTAEFSGKVLGQSCAKKNSTIKKVIMDHKVVAGVGNIYANESLFQAKINPNRIAKSLTLQECNKLAQAIKKVLKKAIKSGGTTLKDFQNSAGKPGYFQQLLDVYGRAGKKCFKCQSVLHSTRMGQRITVWCGKCQL